VNFIVRKAKIEDAKEILDVNIKSWQDTYKGIFSSDYLDNLCSNTNDYEKAIDNNKKKIKNYDNFYVAEIDNKIVGFCSYGDSKKEFKPLAGELYALYVDKKYHGLGIGKELFVQVTKILNQKYDEVIVSCLAKNKSNEFYKRMNCVKIGTCDFILNGKSYEENLYEVNLDLYI